MVFLIPIVAFITGCAVAPPPDVPPDQLRIEEVRAEKGDLSPQGTLRETKSYYLDAKGRQILHGPHIYFFENGRKRLEAPYRHDKLNGLLTEWSSDGDKIREETWVANLREGPAVEWHRPGHKSSERTYHLGRIVGKRLYWNSNGRLTMEEVYDDHGDLAELTVWHDNGTRAKHGQFKGAWWSFDLFSGGPQVTGKRDGTWTYWDKDGKVVAEGQWKNGRPWEGTCIVPREQGSLTTGEKAEYHEGKRVGPVTRQLNF